MSTFLVTGAAGFIGAKTIRTLDRLDHTTIGILSTQPQPPSRFQTP